MPWKFNPFTGNLDLVNSSTPGGGSSITKADAINAILVQHDETLDPPTSEILFDSDSVLHNDDEEL